MLNGDTKFLSLLLFLIHPFPQSQNILTHSLGHSKLPHSITPSLSLNRALSLSSSQSLIHLLIPSTLFVSQSLPPHLAHSAVCASSMTSLPIATHHSVVTALPIVSAALPLFPFHLSGHGYYAFTTPPQLDASVPCNVITRNPPFSIFAFESSMAVRFQSSPSQD